MKPVIIVESPAKARTLEKFLGRRYAVHASKGHVRDLPKSQFGVEIGETFEPKYITIRGKGKVLKDLKEAVRKTDAVYLATDPDREGEAISWHLAQALGLKESQTKRIVFHEVTKEAVRDALKHPRDIDSHLVDAQQARRVMDRLVGYKLSPLLWRKVRRGLSAGRVQSVALRFIVDRELQIRKFKPEEYWTIDAHLLTPAGEEFKASYHGGEGERGRLHSGTEADAVLREVDGKTFCVEDVQQRERRRLPAPPFTTSTLQQEAGRKLGFAVRRTMSIAQTLYEGLDLRDEGRVGLVTYIRTDSTRIAEQAQSEASQFIRERYGEEYAKPAARRERRRIGEQGAHEAIRPTSVLRHPDAVQGDLSSEQFKLYRLIWERFVASQMSPAQLDTTTADIAAGAARFRASGTVVRFPGFLSVYDEGKDEPADAREERLPALAPADRLELKRIVPEQHFTEPPSRYSEAMLVRALEEHGIGRPSTYAPIIQTIQSRGYVERSQRRLQPTELGILVVDLLREHFPDIIDPEFTAALEGRLDKVEEGKDNWQQVLHDFYGPFERNLQQAEEIIGKLPPVVEKTDEICDRCGRPMVIKYGRFGKFLACSGFPECRNTKPFTEPVGVSCPKCSRDIVEKRSKKGRRFYGCSGYPDCDFTSWHRPVRQTCPECGSFLVERRSKKLGTVYHCSRVGCSYKETAESPEEDAGL